jgi:hypothetical protein
MSSAIFGLLIMLFAVVGGAAAIILILTWLRSHRLRIRDPMNQKQYIEEYWMVEKKDRKTGIMNWKAVFWQPKLIVEKPPKEALDVGKRGRKYAECYKLSEDEFVWIQDKGIKVEFDESGKMVAKEILDDGTFKTIDTFKPFTATQRQVLINQNLKANDMTKKVWGSTEILNAALIGGYIMIIALILLFGGDLLAEYSGVRQEAKSMMQMNQDIMRSNALLAQSLGVKIDDLDIIIAQRGEAEGESTIIQPGSEEPPPTDYRKLVGLE